jgi:hypothetical protein
MNAMIDALSAVQKKDLNASTSNLTNSSARFNGSTVTLPVYFDEGKREEERLPGLVIINLHTYFFIDGQVLRYNLIKEPIHLSVQMLVVPCLLMNHMECDVHWLNLWEV